MRLLVTNYISQLRRLAAHRSYRRLLIGGTVSSLGDKIGWIAFLAAVTSHNTDVLAIGGVTIAEMLPALFAAPLVSLVVDKVDRRKLLLAADIARAVIFGLAVIFPLTWVFYTAAFLSAAFTVLFEPARQALEPHYLPEGEVTQANGLRMGLLNLVMVCGPALGGVLVAAFGYKTAFLVNAASFLFSAWMVFDLERVPVEEKEHAGTWQEVIGGYRAVASSFNLRYLFGLFAIFYIVIGIQFPLIYVFVMENLHGGPKELGWLMSGIGIGGIIGGLWLASLKKDHNPFNADSARGKRAIAGLCVLDGIVVVVFATLHSLWPVAALYTFFGFIGTSLHAAVQGAVTNQTTPANRGRVFALFSAMSGPLIVLSIVVGTPLARQYGAANVFYVTGGMEVLLGLGAAALAARSVEKIEARSVLA